MFAALGDPIRLEIVERLCASGPLATMRLTDGAGVTRQGITKHLRVLEQAGLIESRRAGRDREWQVRLGEIAELRARLDQISALWDVRIERLRAFVEED
jgi:DNA-binding transcriptional ArsR family regulator